VVGKYVNTSTPVECVCKQGHTCRPTPTHLQSRGNLCRTCSGRDPVAAETAFRTCVLEQGGRVVGK
jgi:hypothetical protein